MCERVRRVLSDAVNRDFFTIEYFPKQSKTRGRKLGNLKKLPLGIHRRSGPRSAFLDADMSPIRHPFTYLRAPSRDARLVLRHTLGHFPSGLLACNFLHDRTGGAVQDRLVSILHGNPVSCARIRSRLPEVVVRVPCACDLPSAKASYPHPILHLSGPARLASAPQEERPPGDALLDIESEVRRFTQMIRRTAELERDRDALSRHLALALRALPDAAVALPEGNLCLTVESGVEVLEWRPASSGELANAYGLTCGHSRRGRTWVLHRDASGHCASR